MMLLVCVGSSLSAEDRPNAIIIMSDPTSFAAAAPLMKTLSLKIVISAVMLALAHADVVLDFHPGSNVRPRENPYSLTIAGLGGTPPSVSTTDPSRNLPGVTGRFSAGDDSFVFTLDGRNDDTTSWVAKTRSGGTSHPVKGSEAGLGIADTGGAQKVGEGEAIIWSFDLSLLMLAPGESLVMSAADFGGIDEGKHAKFWRRAEDAGSAGTPPFRGQS